MNEGEILEKVRTEIGGEAVSLDLRRAENRDIQSAADDERDNHERVKEALRSSGRFSLFCTGRAGVTRRRTLAPHPPRANASHCTPHKRFNVLLTATKRYPKLLGKLYHMHIYTQPHLRAPGVASSPNGICRGPALSTNASHNGACVAALSGPGRVCAPAPLRQPRRAPHGSLHRPQLTAGRP